LHGPRKNLKYQIKLNDEILDKHKKALSSGSAMGGNLIIGATVGLEKEQVPPQ